MENRVIVVGGGLAGMVAALTAARDGVAVTLIDRGSVGLGTNSALANGVFAGPTSTYSKGKYVRDTMDIGRHINRQASVERMAKGASAAFSFLQNLGITVVESDDLHRVHATRPGIIPGMTLVKGLSETLVRTPGIKIVTGFYVTDLMLRENHIWGIKGFDTKGEELVFSSPAIILATGGAGAVYLRNDNQRYIMGQGYRLAARAGLPLWDMEFIQFYPLVIAGEHLPSTLLYPPHPEEATIRNELGEDILKKNGMGSINRAIMEERDRFSVLLHNESQHGKVFMDFRQVPDFRWKTHPLSILSKLRFNCRKNPVPVSPAAHFCMGGIETDNNGETGIHGLFACGELVWGLHGANRRGGNALLECVVTGQIAGRSSARYLQSFGFFAPHDHRSRGAQDGQTGGRTLPSLREQRHTLRSIAWEYAGIIRDEAGLRRGLEKLRALELVIGESTAEGYGARALREDLLSGAFTLRAIVTASLERKESRGAFIRSDYTDEDNREWKKNSCVQYNPANKDFSLIYTDAG